MELTQAESIVKILDYQGLKEFTGFTEEEVAQAEIIRNRYRELKSGEPGRPALSFLDAAIQARAEWLHKYLS